MDEFFKFSIDDNPEIPNLLEEPSAWPKRGILVPDIGEELKYIEELNDYFEKLKKKIESESPPSSPESDYCQGVLFSNIFLEPQKDRDGNLCYLEKQEWEKLGLLGKGCSGTVFEASDLTTKKEIAVKEIPFEKYKLLEALAWSQLDHDNIPSFYGIVREVRRDNKSGDVFLFSEKIENDTPFYGYEANCKDWSVDEFNEFVEAAFKTVTSTVGYIHSKGFTHGDLGTCGNVVIDDVKKHVWVLDFGEAFHAFESGITSDKMKIQELKNNIYMGWEEQQQMKKLQLEREVGEAAAGISILLYEGGTGDATDSRPAGSPVREWQADESGDQVPYYPPIGNYSGSGTGDVTDSLPARSLVLEWPQVPKNPPGENYSVYMDASTNAATVVSRPDDISEEDSQYEGSQYADSQYEGSQYADSQYEDSQYEDSQSSTTEEDQLDDLSVNQPENTFSKDKQNVESDPKLKIQPSLSET